MSLTTANGEGTMGGLVVPLRVWAPGLVAFYSRRHRDRPAPTVKTATRVHHTVALDPSTPAGELQAMRQLHDIGVARFGSGVSYAFVVMDSGRIYQGMPWDTKQTQSGHSRDANYVEAGIAFAGNYDTEAPTAAAVEAFCRLVAELDRQRMLTSTVVDPHRAVYATTCPGRHLVDELPAIRARIARLIEGDNMPLSDADVKRIAETTADEVWKRVVGLDLSGNPRQARWMLSSARNLSAKAAGLGVGGDDDEESV